MKRSWIALVNRGQPILPHGSPEEMRDFISKAEGKKIKITWDTSYNSRSTAQNNFFHGCIIPAFTRMLTMLGSPKAADIEYTKEVILKKSYLTVNRGEPDEYVRPTSSLTVGEMMDFITWCLQLLFAMGGSLTDSEQDEFRNIIQQYNIDVKIDDIFR